MPNYSRKIFHILILSLLICTSCFAFDDHRTMAIGTPAPDFHLRGVDGKIYSLTSFKNAKVLVVIFMCNHCPTSQAYEERVVKLTKEYKAKGVSVVAINPNDPKALRLDELGYSDVGDSFADMKVRARDKHFNFPYLYDGATEATSKKFGPTSTPHAFIFDAQRKLRYQGRIDDMEDPAKAPTSLDARNAIDALLIGKGVPVAVTKTFGCSVKWAEKRDWIQKAAITWAKEPVGLDTIGINGIKNLLANRSGKLRLINVWATWCSPCVAEFPDLVTINHMYRDRGLEFVSITTDNASARDKAYAFLQRKQASGKNYIYTGDNKYKMIDAIDPKWSGALPYTMLVDPNGKVVYRHQGMINAEKLKKVIFDNPMIGRIYK